MIKKIVSTSMCLLIVSQAVMANPEEVVNTSSKTVILETKQGKREFDNLEALKAAVDAGDVSTQDLREGVALAKTALNYEEVKNTVIVTSQALAVASLLLFSVTARYHQGYRTAMAENGTYTPRERAVLMEAAATKERQAIKNLAMYGVPSVLGTLALALLPDDRVRLSQQLSRLESALSAAERIEQRLQN